MRTAGIILALLFATGTASAQATFERMSAPDAAIHAVVWALPGSPPPPQRTVVTPEYWPPPPRRPTMEDPPSGPLPLPSVPSSPPPRPEPKRRAPVVGAYLEVENRGERVIKAVGWEVSLVDKTSGAERRRLRSAPRPKSSRVRPWLRSMSSRSTVTGGGLRRRRAGALEWW